MADTLTLYTNPMSRGRIARWMLEEVGQPYETIVLDYATTMKGPEYLAINPMGKVPAIKHGDVVVTECAAICAYLADAFPRAGLAPPPNDKLRAPYYRWLFFAAGPLEAAVTNKAMGFSPPADKEGMVGYGTFARVVVAPIAVGGSSVKRWAPGGDLDDRIAATLRSLEATGLPPTHVLWHQGETDVRMPGAEYGEHFRAMLEAARADGLDAPVFVAQASICKNQGSDELRRAQRELAQLPGVHEGPNTDALDRFRWRRDLCHFSGPGLDAHARAWVDVLRRAATDG